jgi:hypothetical protein
VPLVVIPLDFFPGHPRSARGVFQTLLSNNSGHFQHRDAEATEILFSGFSVPLVVIHLDFFPEHPRSAHGVFQTLLSNNSGPFQHRDTEASEILFSGFYMPLVVIHLDFFPEHPRSARGVFQTLLSPKVTHRPRTALTDCRLRSGQLSGKECLMIEG